jgi:molybdopterin converting factor small subunit
MTAPGPIGTDGAAAPVCVRLPGALRPAADGNAVVDVPVDGEIALSALLDVLDARYPALTRRIRDERGSLRRYVNVYIDAVDARANGDPGAAPVRPGAEVLVLPSVAGG